MNDPSSAPMPDPSALALALAAPGVGPLQVVDDGAIDAQAQPALPPDFPAWQRDVVSVSARAKAALATMRAVTVRAVTFWDHAVRSVRVGAGRSIEVDPSGCYMLR